MGLIRIARYFAIHNHKIELLKSLAKIIPIFCFYNSFLWSNTYWIQRNETKIQVPFNWTPPYAEFRIFEFRSWQLIIYSKSFSRGEAFYIEIIPIEKNIDLNNYQHRIYYKNINKQIIVNKRSFGYNAIYAFIPELIQTDNWLEWIVIEPNATYSTIIKLNINLRKYPVSENVIVFRDKLLSDVERKAIQERIKKEREIKKIVFSELIPNQFTNYLSHPRDYHRITSEWYKIRKLQSYVVKNNKKIYSKIYKNIHKGLDLSGDIGDVVFAMADGKIVISENFYYEGNFVLINHGNRIFTGYMHLEQIETVKDTFIKAGMPIGKVGSTGLSTGPHLHVSLWIDNFSIDPLSLLSLPIR